MTQYLERLVWRNGVSYLSCEVAREVRSRHATGHLWRSSDPEFVAMIAIFGNVRGIDE